MKRTITVLLAVIIFATAPILWSTETDSGTAPAVDISLEKTDPSTETCSAVMYCGSYRLSCTGCPADSGNLGLPYPLKGVWVECAGSYQSKTCCPSSPILTTCSADSDCAPFCYGDAARCNKPAGYSYGCCECGVDPV